MNNIKAFIIHLEQAKERHENVKNLMQALPCETEIVKAIDRQQIDQQILDTHYQRFLYRPYYPFKLTQNEIACFLSHRKAWQKIVDDDVDAGLVFEDDVALNENFFLLLSFLKKHADVSSYIRLPFREREEGKLVAVSDKMSLIKPMEVGLGQVAQLIGREAAKKMLKATQQFDRPVDTTLQLYWQTHVRPLVALPPFVQEISARLGGSTLKQKRNIFTRFYREIARPYYRFRLKSLSRRQDD
ncbi:glycosyltransferase family 25 protein [Bartonella tamiae]|uniref:Glycosyl transferase family 25 domain-containing protein n=1 Tax=Bartonella tamiae Th239 TaxID=1094558 RepID=J0R1F5_9HYPH|nr:glycosyltransferase family 25 protein [Bartonella tamiae]EJF89384.1 hypothetical protein ME5_01935 [Bartonella tamiae Th239]EJF92751.1 hypothetical protein MEG_01921 [Bartonella tamiae Th307]